METPKQIAYGLGSLAMAALPSAILAYLVLPTLMSNPRLNEWVAPVGIGVFLVCWWAAYASLIRRARKAATRTDLPQTESRLNQIVLIGTFLGFSWLAMQAVHELGHVIGAAASGGTVNKVVLYPNTISRTDVRPNPHPLVEVWSGAATGALLPFATFLIAGRFRCPELYLFRFFAGFCLVANGVYLGLGSFQGIADAGELLMHGAERWQLILFGIATVPLGLYLWNGIGTHFGLGQTRGKVSRTATLVSLSLFVAVVVSETLVGSR